MFDLIPWLDETYILEMGRLILCGGDPYSTLLCDDGTLLLPLYYIGPAIQELCFQSFGQLGARLCPHLGMIALWLSFRAWLLRNSTCLRRADIELLGIIALTVPLAFQSALLTRIDSWAIACILIAMAILGEPDRPRSSFALFAASFFTVLSPFIWPSAAILLPLPPLLCFDIKRKRELAIFCLFALCSLAVLLVPILTNLPALLASFRWHYADCAAPTTFHIMSILDPVGREIARAPLFLALAGIGFLCWVRRRKVMPTLAFLLALAGCIHTGLYAFRIVYLTPILLLMCADAAVALQSRHPRGCRLLLAATALFGVLTGPVGILALDHPKLPATLKADLAATVGTGPVRVFAPDHATYYIGRELGWRQLGFARPHHAADTNRLASVLGHSDAVVLRDFDPYTPFQQGCTPYNLFCKYILNAAKEERDLPAERKSWAARFGGKFGFSWHPPLQLPGFKEVGKFDMIRVLVRENASQH